MRVAPVYVFRPVPKVASPSPDLVKPPLPDMVAVRLRDPAADEEAVWFTTPVNESFRVRGTEMVSFPVPSPMVVIVAPDPPLSSVSLDPAEPVVSELVKVPVPVRSSNIEPTVKPLVPESLVMVRLLALLAGKTAAAPTALGTVCGFQFEAGVAQLPPPVRFHVCACADGALTSTMFVTAAAQAAARRHERLR